MNYTLANTKSLNSLSIKLLKMKNAEFGAYVKAQRDKKGIPQRIVAHALNIDTSTLSKIELGERQFTVDMVKPLCAILEMDYKALQIKFLKEKILIDFKGQPYLIDAIIELNKQLKAK
jgi:transcriptional regulator with XRE-family HTH domain